MTQRPQLKGELPGPGSRALDARRRAVMPRAVAPALGLAATAAEGAWITDVDGNRLLDFTGGVGVLNLGHRHPAVQAAVARQAAAFLHTDFAVIMYEPLVALAEHLTSIAPIDGPAKAVFFNSGAEAVENAVKFARAFTGRRGLIAFEYGFHGRTWMALSLTGRVHPFRAPFGGMVPDVHHLPYPDPFHLPFGRADATAVVMEAMDRLFATRIRAQDVAAVVVEPVQGEAGVVIPPLDFLAALAARCRQEGILLIADEIQTGLGRTGRMFAVEHAGVHPDLLLLAKALAGGLPLSGVVGRAEVLDAPGPGAVGGTFVGNPVAAAAALAVLEQLETAGLPQHAAVLGQQVSRVTAGWPDRHPLVVDVRVAGAMVGIELRDDDGSGRAAGGRAGAVMRAARDAGLLILRAGPWGRTLRLLFPLTVSQEELNLGLSLLEHALEQVEQEEGPVVPNRR